MNRVFCKESCGSIKEIFGMAALLLCSVACLALCFLQEKSIRESINHNKIVNVVKSTYGRNFELKYMERNDTKKRLHICFHEDNGGVTPQMLKRSMTFSFMHGVICTAHRNYEGIFDIVITASDGQKCEIMKYSK